MLTYNLSEKNGFPLYQRLYELIKADILNHSLKPGDKLPSKRAFAKNLGISVITVENTYSQLYAEGYIFSVPKKGFYISDINLYPSAEIFHNKNSYKSDLSLKKSSEPPLADFSGNIIAPSSFPFSIWAKLSREVINTYRDELVTKSPYGGIHKLRQAICSHLKAYRNMEVDPSQVVVGAGTEYLYGLIIQLLGFNKRYGIEDPCYEKIASIYNKHQVSCTYVPMDESGVNVKSLNQNNIDVIHISPSHHFPTGIVMPIKRRLEILRWAEESDERYIIEDDYDSEFRMNGRSIPAMQCSDVYGKVIYMNTFSKTLSSTVRISYMVLPRSLAEQFKKELSFYSCTVSNFEQYTLAEFIENGYFEKHINRMRNYYRKKRNLLLSAIEESGLSKYTSILEKDSGLHFIMKLNINMEDNVFIEKLKRRKIILSALSGYYHINTCRVKHQFVINYSSLSDESVEKAVNEIYSEILKSMSKT